MGNSRLVYSTATGRVCPQCSQPIKQCRCQKRRQKAATHPASYPDDGTVRIRREVKGRGGKTVTTVWGISLAGQALKQFAKTLKQRCGTGGSVKAGVIVIQGDHREMLAAEIKKQGYTVKVAGG